MAEPAGLLARLGTLVIAPRRLARRDLDVRDGRASDDLFVVALLALCVEGAVELVHAGQALVAARYYTALGRLTVVLRPAVPLLGLWLVSALLFALFTWRAGGPRRAVGELGARVAQGFVLTSLVMGPIANLLGPEGLAAYVLRSLPWAASALLFGLLLREALEPVAEAPTPTPLPDDARAAALTLLPFALVCTMMHVHQSWTHQGRRGEPMSRPGQAAPDVALPLLGGGELRLEPLRGKKVLLNFWATWCGPCRTELPVLQRLVDARGPGGPAVYTINIDDVSPQREALVQRAASQLGLRLPIAIDDGKAANAWAIATIPSLAVIDEQGQLVRLWDRPLDEAELKDLLR